MESQAAFDKEVHHVSEEISLLWPGEKQPGPGEMVQRLDENGVRDLELDKMMRTFKVDIPFRVEGIEHLFLHLCNDLEVLKYRLDILDDLMSHPELADQMLALFPKIDALGYRAQTAPRDMTSLYEVSWQMGQLEIYVDCIQGLQEAFQATGELASAGLQALRELVNRVAGNETFSQLVAELPDLRKKLHSMVSITIGVNLDAQLQPVEATLLSVNNKRFVESSFLKRLFGQAAKWAGIAPLHAVPRRQAISSDSGFVVNVAKNYDPDSWAVEPMMVPLFKDLAKVTEKVTKPISEALGKYVAVNIRTFANLREDFVFYLGAVRLFRQMQAAGMPVCRPKIAPAEARVFHLAGGYNINLALHLLGKNDQANLADVIVKNEIRMDGDGRIFVLTGPNQGGKTTYTQTVGLAQVMAQVGLFVPGEHAEISPVDAIYTHFPIEEKISQETGRFGDEARRLGEIFQQISPHSLLLLNESFSSTSAGEGLYLARDLLRVMRRIGVRAIFATHLHELAEGVDALNAEIPGDSAVISMVATLVESPQGADAGGDIRRAYRIIPSPPMGRSYAREIARRYGISYEQLVAGLTDRKLI